MHPYLKNLILGGYIAVFITSQANATQPAAAFLSSPGGARSAALGNALSADAMLGEDLFINPASLARMETPSVWLAHNEAMLDSKTETVGFSMPRASSGFGVAARYFSDGTLERTGESASGELVSGLGDFRPYTALLHAAAAKRIRSTAFGFGVSAWDEHISDKSQTGWAGTLGVQHPINNWASVGLVRANQGPSFHGDPLPSSWNAGFSIHPVLHKNQFVRILGEYDITDQGVKNLRSGIEYTFQGFSVRVGHTDLLTQNSGGLLRFSMGAGIRVRGILADYAWREAGELGQEHLFSLSFALGQTAEEKAASARALDMAMNKQIAKRAASDVNAGAAAMADKNWDLAIEKYSQALTWNPLDQNARKGLQSAENARAVSLDAILRADIERNISERQWIDASASLRDLQKIVSDDEWITTKQRQIEDGIKTDAATAKQPKTDLFVRGSQHYIDGDYESALKAWQEALSIDPANPLVREYIAKARTRIAEQKLEAQKDVNAQSENSAEAMSRTAYIYYSVGKTDDAIALWRKVLILDPNNSDARMALKNAQARRSLGHTETSGIGPKLEDLNRQALEEYSNGHAEAAVLIWKKALLLDPNNVRLKNNIQRVENEIATNEISR